MKRHILLLLMAVTAACAHSRENINFDDGWLFTLADSAQMAETDYDDSQWRSLNLPHDWSIEGDFSATAPASASGGALPGGIGWYRKHFTIDAKDKADAIYICFDGVYMNSTVYVNGNEIGTRPYGFISFAYDITPFVNRGTGDNVIAVRVDNSLQPNCRWYSGSGIYRHVYMLKTATTRVSQWGTYVTATPSADFTSAIFDITVEVDNGSKAKVTNIITDMQGNEVGRATSAYADAAPCKQRITIAGPHLWSIEDPYIYKVTTEVRIGGKKVDEYVTTTGVRTFAFDAEKGFSLNGKAMKLNGVCQHHDLGCLGAAVNADALHRQLAMLRDMGCNAIRCSHNPPAPELLDLCDTMGFVVMDEAFDMWHRKKTKYDYSEYFDEWFERDLSDFVRRDRNHPCIIMWSIGNEVLEQWSSEGSDELTPEEANLVLNFGHDASTLAQDGEMSVNSLLTKRLVDIIKTYDTTRPVTAGCNEPAPNNHLFKSGALDIIGYNYHNANVPDVPANFPGMPFIYTESVSGLMTRGHYVMPSDSLIVAPLEWWRPYTDPSYACSSYDNCRAPWANNHEETWDIVKHNDFVGGQFIWTGWDYIGEPTPYGFPARSSYFGIIDLAGFPKDIYYFYQSEWTDKPVLHLFPHWNWLPGQQIDLWCYYNNADEVELFVNGKSQGVRSKADSHQYHVVWNVTYEPGSVTVVARKNGNEVGRQTINTAGAPSQLRLTADKSVVSADGKSLVFVTVDVLDADGNLCPLADNQVYFDVEGAAFIAGVDNGAQASMERFKDNKRKAFAGKCLVVLQNNGDAGSVRLTARAVGLSDASVAITAQ